MAYVMVDSNVILDIVTEDPIWFEWSSEKLRYHIEHNILVINPIIYSEVSISFKNTEDIDVVLPKSMFTRQQIPWEAAFLAGKSFVEYRAMGGKKRSPLPDFFIGAHALTGGMDLVTRDAARYRTYFPKLNVISPK